jgi:hypothetical protein
MRDLRRYARQTNTRLFVGFLLILVFVGLGLIAIIYGPQSALFGLVCLAAGLAPLILIWLALLLIEWIARRANPE